MKKRILAALLAATMVLTVAGCDNSKKPDTTTKAGDTTTAAGDTTTAGGDTTTAADEVTTTTTPENTITGNQDAADAIYLWTWNTDIQAILDGVLKEVDEALYNRIVYVNTGGSGYYQTKLDGILDTPDNKQYPDIIALEADYILKYTNSADTLPIADLGITTDDLKNQYQYTQSIASVDGVLKASSWQAAAGGWAIRTDLSEKYLGVTKKADVQAFFKDWDTVLSTAKTVKEKSSGATLLLAGMDDVFRVYKAASTTAWAVNDVITVSPEMQAYMDFAKELYTNKYTQGTTQWTGDWEAKKTDDSVLAWPSCTWFTYWCLDKGHYGKYVMVEGPQAYYWGGTWLAATSGCSDKEAVGKIIKYITCDDSFMTKINGKNCDYVNNTKSIQTIIDNNTQAAIDGVAILNADAQGQTLYQFFQPLVEKVSVTTMLGEDQTIDSAFNVQLLEYVKGTKDKDTAIADFKTAVNGKFTYFKVA